MGLVNTRGPTITMSTNNSGFTQKELLKLVIERLDRLEEKLDNKLDKSEFYKVLGLVATVILIVGSLSKPKSSITRWTCCISCLVI
jgi:hypothetical protein